MGDPPSESPGRAYPCQRHIVCAENRSNLNPNILKLIDQTLEFKLPDSRERREFLESRINVIFDEYKNNAVTRIISNIFSASKIQEIVAATDGSSYADLELIVREIKKELALQNEQFSKEDLDDLVKSLISDKKLLIA